MFGPWQTVWKRHRRWAADGTWDSVLARLTSQADSIGEMDWTVPVDSTINRAHQHATNTTRPESDTGAATRRGESEATVIDREPAARAVGRSRGGLTTKIHHAVDGNGRPPTGHRGHPWPGSRRTDPAASTGRYPGPAMRPRQATNRTGRPARRQGVLLQADPRRPRS